MTLIFDDEAAEPRVHAFLIGIGGYKSIDEPHPNLPLDLRLPPLPSAPSSTMKLARWLQEHLQEADARPTPLGSLELLLADPATRPVYTTDYDAPDGTKHPVDLATLNAIKQAFGNDTRGWFKRCERDSGNTALFYFCGHGFMTADTLLLAHDFATISIDWFGQTIAFDEFFKGMAACKAKRQVFFADCCRQVPDTALRYLGKKPGDPLIPHTATALGERDDLGLMAAAPGAKAFALPNEPTQFTKALLEALDGRGAQPMSGDEWHVTFNGLVQAVSRSLAEGTEAGAPYQKPYPLGGAGRVSLRVLPGPPDVPVILRCVPNVAIIHADLSIRDPCGVEICRQAAGAADKFWRSQVPPARYVASATFANVGLGYVNKNQPFWAMPPGHDEPLKVQ